MKWRCQVCGYVHDGEEAPEKCPKCGAGKDRFAQVAADEAGLIDRSRRTNDLHLQLSALLDKVATAAQEGIDDNLDPGCVNVFKKAAVAATEIKQMIKAEIQTHISKGKWG
ncbi:MAG: rubredoxin [Clostridia bacterium]|nr:MAG: rubredoxin [Clostridia bacterium]